MSPRPTERPNIQTVDCSNETGRASPGVAPYNVSLMGGESARCPVRSDP
jgi:hypothetical protein